MEACCRNCGGIGLSAVQTGIPLKLFIVDVGGEFRAFANTTYLGLGEKSLSVESCLSLRNRLGMMDVYKVQRFESVEINGFELLHRNLEKPVFSPIKEVFVGRISVVFQHEIDHSDGVLISDIGERVHLWK
jgi:peptide deformylase